MFFLTLQYPVVDARRFVDLDVLRAPDWPQPASGEFVRCFGAARSRRGFPGWIPEPRFVDGRRAVRLPRQFELGRPGTPSVARARPIGQRLFLDGLGSGKFELVLKVASNSGRDRLGIGDVAASLAGVTADVRVAARGPERLASAALGRLGPTLAKALVFATTPNSVAGDGRTPLLVGEPLLLVETGERSPLGFRALGEEFTIATQAERVMKLRHATMRFGGGEARVWHVARHREDQEHARQIRVSLLRLHAERCALQTVLRLLAQDRIRVAARSAGSDALQRFLTHSSKRVLDLKRMDGATPEALDWRQGATVELARRLDAMSTPGSLELILDKLEAEIDVRPTVLTRLADAAAPAPGAAAAPAAPGPPRRFRVALSFPGERRTFFAAIAEALAGTLGKAAILYDEYHTEELAQPNLDVRLPRLYLNDSDLVVVGFCKEYTAKPWTGLEWRFIRQHIQNREDARLLLLRLDDIEMDSVDGLTRGDGYVDCRARQPAELVRLIEQRLVHLGVLARRSA